MQSHAESARTLQQFCPYRNQDFFLHIFPINKGPMLCTLSSGLGGLLTFYDPFLIKVDQPENLFSLEVFFLYTSNLCEPPKVLNRVTFSWSKGAVGYKKELLYPDLYIEENERCKVMQSQLKHSSSFALIETRIFFCIPFP